MREGLLALLRCPRCAGTSFTMHEAVEDAGEIRAGRLHCSCGADYGIEAGIPDLTLPGAELERARAHAFADACASSGLIRDEADLLDFEGRHRRMKPAEACRYSFGLMDNLDQAIAAMALRPGMTVLDVGAGATWATARLARLGVTAIATDLVRTRWAGLESADSLLARGPHYERVLAEMDRLPFRDASFDRVLFHASIHHSEALARTMTEAARLLRPGASLWLVNEPVGSMFGLFDGRFTAQMRDAGEHIYQLSHYRAGLAEAGLEVTLFYSPGVGTRLDALARLESFPPASSKGQALKYALVLLALRAWRSSALFRRLFERHFFFWGLSAFGQFLVARGVKPTGEASHLGANWRRTC